jgi:succinate-semialdehyde dehydrogenase / glutarate-semialdehyde dehydrogenase
VVAQALPSPVSGLFVHGVWQSIADEGCVAVNDPATGKQLAVVTSATPTDALSAAAAAAAARATWRSLPAVNRAEIFERIVRLLRHHEADMARTIVQENGKTLAEAIAEVDWACAFFQAYAEEGKRLAGRMLAKVPGKQPSVRLEACGAVLAITPWNDPLGMIARQIAPALAAGCTVVWKPASLTPLTAIRFAHILADAGLPPGVVNLFVTSASDACVSRVLESGFIQKLIFTGSTLTGRRIASKAAAVGVPSTLELGGNAACIVLNDADLDGAAEGIVLRKFVQAGQGCTCINRLFIDRDVAEQLLDLIVGRVSAIKLGHGFERGVTMGPLIRPRDVERIHTLISAALSAGAKVLWRGELPSDDSLQAANFCEPHILTQVRNSMQLAQEEIFGPVLPVIVFDDVEEAVGQANEVQHGLAGYVYGESCHALAVAQELEVGLVGVNDASPQAPYYPVGGRKASGWGAAGAHEGLLEYVKYKAISQRVSPS